MYSGTKIEKYNGGTFTEQPFAGGQSSKNILERVHNTDSSIDLCPL